MKILVFTVTHFHTYSTVDSIARVAVDGLCVSTAQRKIFSKVFDQENPKEVFRILQTVLGDHQVLRLHVSSRAKFLRFLEVSHEL